MESAASEERRVSRLFWWTGVVVWAAAAIAALLFVVVNLAVFAGRWVSFVRRLKPEYRSRWFGSHPGRLGDGDTPAFFLRLPGTGSAVVVVWPSAKRWELSWPTILLPHSNVRSSQRLVWPYAHHMYVTDVRVSAEREPSLVRGFAAQILVECDRLGVTTHVLTDDGLPAGPVGRQATVIVAYASMMTSEVAGLAVRMIGYGCSLIYVDDTPPVVLPDDNSEWPAPLFQFPSGSRAVTVQVSPDGRVYENGVAYEWAACPATIGVEA